MPLEEKNKKEVVKPNSGSENKIMTPEERSAYMSQIDVGRPTSEASEQAASIQMGQSGGVVLSDAQQEEMDAYEFTNEERQWAIQKGSDVNDMLYEKQSGWSMANRAVTGGLYTGGLNALKTATDLAGGEWFDGDEGDNNAASDFLQERVDQYKEYNPIYSQGTFDPGWWMNGVQGTIDSAVTFALPGGVAGKLATSAMRLAGARGIFANLGARFLTSTLTNQVETQLMANQMHKDMYTEMIEKGYTHDIATETVQKSVDDFKMWNRLMIATDYIGMGSLMGAPITGGAKKSLFKKGLGTAKDMGAEAIEEIYGDGIVEHFTKSGLMDSGALMKDGKGSFERSLHWLKDEGWESGFWGIAGGPTQKYGRQGIQYGLDKVTGRSKLDMIPEPPKFDKEQPIQPSKKLPEIPLPKHQVYTNSKGETEVKVIEPSGEKTYTQEAWEDRKNEIEAEYNSENSSLIDDWNKYQSELDTYNEEKKASEDSHRLWEEATRNRSLKSLTGTKGQAVKDVSKFLNEQASLEKEWQEAIESDDEISKREVLDRKIEGIFLRYAENGQEGDGKGSVEQLETALKASIEDGNENAQLAYDKVQDLKGKYDKAYRAAYRTQDPSVARQMAAQVMKAESGMDSALSSIELADSKMEQLRASIISNAQKLHPGKQAGLHAEIKSKEVEISALETMASKINDKAIQAKLRKRKKQLEQSVKEEKENLTEPIDDSDFNEEDIAELEKLSNQKAENIATYNSYKTQSANMQKKDYFKNKREERFLEYDNLIKEANHPAILDAIREKVQQDNVMTASQKRLAYDYIKGKYNEAVDYQEELEKQSEQHNKRAKELKERINYLNKAIREHYSDTLVQEDGLTETEYNLEYLEEKRKEVFNNIVNTADAKERRNLRVKLKRLKEKQESLRARVKQRKSSTLPVDMLERQLDKVKEKQAELVTSSLSPFSSSLKKNPKLKKALHKLVSEQDLTIRELELLLELPGTKESFKSDMKRRISKAKETAKHTGDVAEQNYNNEPGKEEKTKSEEKQGTVIVPSQEGGTIVETPQEGGTIIKTQENEAEAARQESYNNQSGKGTEDSSKVAFDEAIDEDDEIEKAQEEEERKKEPIVEGRKEPTDELPFDDDDAFTENSEETVDDSKPKEEVQNNFTTEEKPSFDVLDISESIMPTSFKLRLNKEKGLDKNLLGGTIWLSDPKNASDKTNTELKLVVRDGKLYWSPNMEVQDNYFKTKPFREVLLPFASRKDFDLENGEGSYDVLLENVEVYLDEYTTNIIDMSWNEMSMDKKGDYKNPLPNLGIEPNESRIAISINGDWSESGTKEGGNTPASWMTDTWTNEVNHIVLDYKTPDGKQANLPLLRAKINDGDANHITNILKEMFNEARKPKFSMKEFWNREYNDPGSFENVSVREALDSLVDINYSNDIQYSGPTGNLNVSKTGDSAIYIKYKDGKNKREPRIFFRNKAGEEINPNGYSADDLNNDTKVQEIKDVLANNYLAPAQKWRINTPININTENAFLKGVSMSKGDTWNNFYFKSGNLVTNAQYAQSPRENGKGSYGAHELHGGVKMKFAPIKKVTKSTKEENTVRPLQQESIDADKIYTAASMDIAKKLAEIC